MVEVYYGFTLPQTGYLVPRDIRYDLHALRTFCEHLKDNEMVFIAFNEEGVVIDNKEINHDHDWIINEIRQQTESNKTAIDIMKYHRQVEIENDKNLTKEEKEKLMKLL